MSEQTTLTMLVHGEAGAGKSWLGNSSPAPRLICDAEGRAKYLPSTLPKVMWDPRQQAPPVADGSWETCVAIVPDFQTMDLVFQWLQSGDHGFRSVVVDSLMEIQMRLIDDVAGMEQLKTQDWGVVLRKLEKLTRDYRDLVIRPSNTVDVVVFTVGSKVDASGKQRPMLQGQMATKVPYFVDVVGYLYTTFSPETGEVSRSMLTVDTQTAVAKDGTDMLPGPTVPSPNLTQIFNELSAATVAPAPPVVSTEQPTEQAAPAG